MVVVGWGAGAWRQSRMWYDSETLWRRALQDEPDCAICRINLADDLMAPAVPGPAPLAEAETLLRRAIELRPDRAWAHHLLGVTLALQGRYNEAEAPFQEYVRREPKSAVGLVDLGLLRIQQGRYPEAVAFLRRALAMDPQVLSPALARALKEQAGELRRQGGALEADALLKEVEALSATGPGGPARLTPAVQPPAATTAR